MAPISVALFGKFSVRHREQVLCGVDSAKVQELFSYLLVHRARPHPRETLASLLWGDSLTAQSKKYLRQALWQLQTALDCQFDEGQSRVLVVHPDWVQINGEADIWLDVAVFEQAFNMVQGVDGRELDHDKSRVLEEAVQLYRGDLLEGWYQDWCLYERERLQNMYLALLDKLMDYCEANRLYESGLNYGERILAYDRARERTHRRQMRLRYLAGDRTGALRQFDRCVSALNEELGVGPASNTQKLCEQIRADSLDVPSKDQTRPQESPDSGSSQLPQMLRRFEQLQAALSDIQNQVQQGIKAVESALRESKRNQKMNKLDTLS